MGSPAPPGWYPDPARTHHYRYFNGAAWTDHVSDNGVVMQAPLGLTQSGLVEVPRAKMWILAALSASVFWIYTPDTTVIVPIGFIFTIWCWRTTAAALRMHEQAGSPAAGEIRAARWVALGLGVVTAAAGLLSFR
jgi:hypothetical protein